MIWFYFIYITASKRQNYSDGVKISGAGGWGRGEHTYKRTAWENILGEMELFFFQIMVMATWIYTCVMIYGTVHQKSQFYCIIFLKIKHSKWKTTKGHQMWKSTTSLSQLSVYLPPKQSSHISPMLCFYSFISYMLS